MVISAKRDDAVEKLSRQSPVPTTILLNGQSGASTAVIINPVDGYAAIVDFRIRRCNTATTFELRDNNDNMLDDVAVVANGSCTLKVFLQPSGNAIMLGVKPLNLSAQYDMTVNIFRHRVTGVI